MFGRGPYRSYDCKPSTNTAENFANMVAELRQTAEQNGIPIEWQNYDTIIERASEAIHNNDLKGGIYHYSRGISFLVAAFKNRNSAQQISDSHVDLF